MSRPARSLFSRRTVRHLIGLALTCCTLVLSAPSHAHSINHSVLKLEHQENHLTGEWSIPLKFLDVALDFDLDRDQHLTWQELVQNQSRIETYLGHAVHFTARSEAQAANQNQGTCQIEFQSMMLQNLQEGVALFFPFEVRCDQAIGSDTALELRYRLFFDEDPLHRGFIQYQRPGVVQNWIAAPSADTFHLGSITVGNTTSWSTAQQASLFVEEGIWHILIGWDHLLFLLALLIPAIFYYPAGERTVHRKFAPMLRETIRIVTAFTLSHSITLGVAAFGLAVLPVAWVETAIAASVVVSAAFIWLPHWHPYRTYLAFGFGLIHGFGFANVLSELALPQDSFALSLFTFNVGVELGQLAIAAAVLPLMFVLRQQRIYTDFAIPSLMIMIGSVGMFWMFERVPLCLYCADSM